MFKILNFVAIDVIIIVHYQGKVEGIMDKLYINIKNRRKELGLSQKELATKLGYTSDSTVAKVEVGAVDLSMTKIVAYAKALETDVTTLMGWADDPKEQHENKLLELFDTLEETQQEKLVDFAQYLLTVQNKNNGKG